MTLQIATYSRIKELFHFTFYFLFEYYTDLKKEEKNVFRYRFCFLLIRSTLAVIVLARIYSKNFKT